MRLFTALFLGILYSLSVTAQEWVSVDVNPNGSSNPEGFYQWGTEMFFTADDGNGRKVYKTDGTVAGTIPLTGPNFDMGYVFNFEFKEYNGELYFTGDDGVNGRELWKTDGTVVGTQMVADVNPSGASDPTGLCVAGGKLFFGWAPQGLWMTDGTEVGTVQVQDPNSTDFIPYANDGMVELNGMLIFSGQHSVAGRELYVSDGTAVGTTLLKDIYPGVFASYPAQLTKVPDLNEVFFVASDGTHGEELWKTDGTEAGTVLVHDVVPGSTGSNPGNITPFMFDQLTATPGVFFTADDPTTGNEVLFTDGVQDNPSPTLDINIGLGSSSAQSLTTIFGTMVCAGRDLTNGMEINIFSDLSIDANAPGGPGISALGTVMDILVGEESSYPDQFYYDPLFGIQQVFFTAESAEFQRDLWGSVGMTTWFGFRPEETRAGGGGDPYIIEPPTATETDPLYGGSFALLGTDKMVISAAYTTIGQELWVYTPETVTNVSEMGVGDDKLIVSPNPTTGVLNIAVDSESKENLTIELFDVCGKRISVLDHEVSNGKYKKTVSLPQHISNGVYMVVVHSSSSLLGQKIILNR